MDAYTVHHYVTDHVLTSQQHIRFCWRPVPIGAIRAKNLTMIEMLLTVRTTFYFNCNELLAPKRNFGNTTFKLSTNCRLSTTCHMTVINQPTIYQSFGSECQQMFIYLSQSLICNPLSIYHVVQLIFSVIWIIQFVAICVEAMQNP